MGKAIIIKDVDFSANAIEKDYKLVKGVIASSSDQLILSDIPFTDNFKVELAMKYNDLTQEGRLFGSKFVDGLNLHASPSNGNFGLFYVWDSSASEGVKVGSNPTSTDAIYKVVIENNIITINDAITAPCVGKPTDPYIFGGVVGASASVMIGYELFYYKQWNDGVLVTDAVPVLKKDGTVCLMNRVDGNFYYASSNPDYEE